MAFLSSGSGVHCNSDFLKTPYWEVTFVKLCISMSVLWYSNTTRLYQYNVAFTLKGFDLMDKNSAGENEGIHPAVLNLWVLLLQAVKFMVK